MDVPACAGKAAVVGIVPIATRAVGRSGKARTTAGRTLLGRGTTFGFGRTTVVAAVNGLGPTLRSTLTAGTLLRGPLASRRMPARHVPRPLFVRRIAPRTTQIRFIGTNEWSERSERCVHEWDHRLREREHSESSCVERLQASLKWLDDE